MNESNVLRRPDIEAAAKRVVDQAPPFTEKQGQRLLSILGPHWNARGVSLEPAKKSDREVLIEGLMSDMENPE